MQVVRRIVPQLSIESNANTCFHHRHNSLPTGTSTCTNHHHMSSGDEKDLNDDASVEDEISHADASHAAATEEDSHIDSHVDDERSMDTAPDHEDDEDDEEDDDDGKAMSTREGDDENDKADISIGASDGTPLIKKKRRVIPPSARRGRAPAVKGLTIPFRTVKKVGIQRLDDPFLILLNAHRSTRR